MERWIETIVYCSGWLVPLLAVWAVTCLYSLKSGCHCNATECVYFGSLLLIAGFTIRTVIADDNCWLVHTASLGVMVVAGAMRKPAAESRSLQLAKQVW